MIGLQMLSNLLMLVPIFVTSEYNFKVCNISFVDSSLKSEGKALHPPRQHWDVRHGGRGFRPADQPELAAAHLRHRLRHRRPRLGIRLPQVAPPVEDHSAGGFNKFSFAILDLILKEPESWKAHNEQKNPLLEKVGRF